MTGIDSENPGINPGRVDALRARLESGSTSPVSSSSHVGRREINTADIASILAGADDALEGIRLADSLSDDLNVSGVAVERGKKATAVKKAAGGAEIVSSFEERSLQAPKRGLIGRFFRHRSESNRITLSPEELVVQNQAELGTDIPPAPGLDKVDPSRRPLAEKIWQGAQIGVKNWAMNVNPRNFIDKDWYWRAGAFAGMGESAVFMVFAPLPGGTWVRAGANLAFSQAVYRGARIWEKRMVSGVEKRYAGQDPSDTAIAENRQKDLADIERGYRRFDARAKNFFLGLSAGAAYGSVLSAVGVEIFKSVTEQGISTTAAQVQAIAPKSYVPMPEPPQVEAPVPPVEEVVKEAQAAPAALVPGTAAPVPTGDPLHNAVSRISEAQHLNPGAAADLEKDFRNQVAAAVGERLSQTNEVANEAIKSMGVDPNQISQHAFEQVRMTVQEEMQSKVNEGVARAIEHTNNMNEIITQSHTTLNEALDTNAFHEQMLAEAKTTLVKETLKEQAAAMVGQHIEITNQVVDQALDNADVDPHQLTTEAYEGIRENIQGELEKKVNVFDENFDYSVTQKPGANLEEIVTQAKTSFAQSVDSTQFQGDLTTKATSQVDSYIKGINAAEAVIDSVLKTGEQLKPDLVTEVTINRGDTIGQLLIDKGYDFTSWGPEKADILGAHVAVNYDLLNNYWGDVANVQNLPNEFHFPAGIHGDLKTLIELARTGDADALQKLKDALWWIPPDKKIKILSTAGVKTVLALYHL